MILRGFLGLCLAAMAVPAVAQSPFPSGVLQAPSKPPPPAPAPRPPQPAPPVPVERVAPLSTPDHPPSELGRAAVRKPTPVVRPPRSSHAQREPAKEAKEPAKESAKAPAAAVPPPVVPRPPPAPPAEAARPAEPTKGSTTGLPLPRWVALRADEVNLRSGPGTRYPVEWVYHRRDLPMEILREFEVWRLVRDQDGVMGWVHQATLIDRRSFVVTGKQAVLRNAAADDAAAVALLQPGVIGRIRSCQAGKDWCEMQVGEYRGWLRREAVWGVYPNEAVN